MLLDPKGMLPAVDWQTRSKVADLAARFRAQTGMVMRVRSGRRTCAEQAEQVRLGFSHAAGCRSWHVLGRAVDVDILKPDGTKVGIGQPYAVAGAIWEQMGGIWGGRFIIGGYPDEGHFEWHPGLTIGQFCPDPSQCERVAASIRTAAPSLLARLGTTGTGLLGAAVVLGVYWIWFRRR